MEKIIKAAVDRGASDLHIKAGDVFRARIDGKLVALTKQALTPEQTKAIAMRLIHNEEDRARIDKLQDYDCSWGAAGIGRFRVNAFTQLGRIGIVLRVIQSNIPKFDELRLPPVMAELSMTKRGLIIMVGATGSGKSTTLASMIGHRNEHSYGHIVTIEDPVEYVHPHRNCIVTHREVGVDTASWEIALKNTLRQAPDVILIGEIRDREAMDHAIAFAETGHLVMCTLHANSTNQALDRIINFFPEERRQQLLMDLSLNLRASVAQRLIPFKDRKGRIPAVELMLNSPLIADLIFKQEVHEIKEVMKRSREQGMQTFDQSLYDLHETEQISYEDALRNADSVNDVRLQIKLNSKLYGGVAGIHKGIEHLGLTG